MRIRSLLIPRTSFPEASLPFRLSRFPSPNRLHTYRQYFIACFGDPWLSNCPTPTVTATIVSIPTATGTIDTYAARSRTVDYSHPPDAVVCEPQDSRYRVPRRKVLSFSAPSCAVTCANRKYLHRYSAWRKAFNALPEEDRQLLDPCDIHDCLKKIRDAVQKQKEVVDAKSWKYTKDGEQIVLRDVADKLINWVDRFKAIGNVVASFDPIHAALPWAGCRFLLEV